MYSVSVIERAMIVCFLDFHNIAPPAEINTSPVVDFFSSALPNVALVYPMRGNVGL